MDIPINMDQKVSHHLCSTTNNIYNQ